MSVLLPAAGLVDSRSASARKAGDPFTVLIASGTRAAANTPKNEAHEKPDHVTARHTARRSPGPRGFVLDGAMGTRCSAPADGGDFRGARFKDHPRDMRRQQRRPRPDAP